MSVLSKNERDGLEDVFLSIHTHQEKYERIKSLASLLFCYKNDIKFKNIFKKTHVNFQEKKLLQFFKKNF
jgi:hypothetical protein